MPATRLQVRDPLTDELDAVRASAAEVFRAGGTVIFPTETVYGIAAMAASDEAVDRLCQLKQKPDGAFTWHAPSASTVLRAVEHLGAGAKRLAGRLMPGPVTIVIDVDKTEQAALQRRMGWSRKMANRLIADGQLAMRCPDHPAAAAVLGSVEGPVVAAGAAGRGRMSPRTADDVESDVAALAGLVVDGGPSRHAKPSTVIHLSQRQGRPVVTMRRPGVVDERYIRKLMAWNILLVCSGNTCRSPMAEGIARQLLAEQNQTTMEGLGDLGISVSSAGTFASEGLAASPEAVEVMADQQIDLSSHRSRRLSRAAVNQADVIYCMTASHLAVISEQFPDARAKAQLLDPDGGDVSDPVGASKAVYGQTARQIRDLLTRRLKEQPT